MYNRDLADRSQSVLTELSELVEEGSDIALSFYEYISCVVDNMNYIMEPRDGLNQSKVDERHHTVLDKLSTLISAIKDGNA